MNRWMPWAPQDNDINALHPRSNPRAKGAVPMRSRGGDLGVQSVSVSVDRCRNTCCLLIALSFIN